MIRALLCAAFVAFVSPAAAQTTDAAPIERARAMIAEFSIGDVFSPIEHERITVRHGASGLTCHFSGQETRYTLMTFEGLPRGEDVGCNAEITGRSTTLYATRYAPPITVEEALADGIEGIRGRWADARPINALVTMQSEQLPDYLTQHFVISLRGQQYITSVMVAEVDGWIFKLRYTELAADEDALRRSQLEANAIFVLALLERRPTIADAASD